MHWQRGGAVVLMIIGLVMSGCVPWAVDTSDVEQVIRQYGAHFQAQDAGQIADLYAYPSLLEDGASVWQFDSKVAMERFYGEADVFDPELITMDEVRLDILHLVQTGNSGTVSFVFVAKLTMQDDGAPYYVEDSFLMDAMLRKVGGRWKIVRQRIVEIDRLLNSLHYEGDHDAEPVG